MLTRTQKQEQVDTLRDKFGRATSVFVADYRGLTVGQATDLRTTLRSETAEVEYQVVNVGDLGTLFPEGGTVGPEELAAAGAVVVLPSPTVTE